MVEKCINKPHDPIEERFMWLEAQVVYINCNVMLKLATRAKLHVGHLIHG